MSEVLGQHIDFLSDFKPLRDPLVSEMRKRYGASVTSFQVFGRMGCFLALLPTANLESARYNVPYIEQLCLSVSRSRKRMKDASVADLHRMVRPNSEVERMLIREVDAYYKDILEASAVVDGVPYLSSDRIRVVGVTKGYINEPGVKIYLDGERRAYPLITDRDSEHPGGVASQIGWIIPGPVEVVDTVQRALPGPSAELFRVATAYTMYEAA